jgi:ParB/RepB/Spo0J family partition protein
MAGAKHPQVEKVRLIDIFVVGDRRPLDGAVVKSLAESIGRIGLRTPITIRVVDRVPDPDGGADIEGAYALVAGRHRLEAMRQLGEETIPAIVMDGDEIDAELWEIVENLHRADLSKEQRDQQIRRYAELLTKKESGEKPTQVARVSDVGGRGNKGLATKVAEQTGMSRDTVLRAIKPEKVAAERRRASIDADVKERAAKEVANVIAEYVPAEWWDGVKANLYAAGAKNIANELTNISGQSVMDARHAPSPADGIPDFLRRTA